ncbi:hypothetical protein [Campylobacter lari]|uniref:hypothetical protein n=1 Tax=Campylobacter lari TaxID=201 RepID=UPI0021539B87|nr:hypothetical protein [Campylobacter lari]MCR6565547.1 hypothetical protein [Campylobacter lari]
MGTRSLIGIEDKGVVKYTYCSLDGYVEYVGKTLLMSYQDKEKINKLMELKNICSLCDKLEDIEYSTTEKIAMRLLYLSLKKCQMKKVRLNTFIFLLIMLGIIVKIWNVTY